MVDLNRLVTKAIKAVHSLCSKKNITINVHSVEQSTYIDGEELLCLSIFNNLIKNAVEASPDHENIEITITEQSDGIEFKLHNTGAIPVGLRDTLFEKYSSSNHIRGSGLGAYSAKLMTEAQKGSISFEVIDDTYTEFTVVMPAY